LPHFQGQEAMPQCGSKTNTMFEVSVSWSSDMVSFLIILHYK
jgi:hypothetical protein